MYAPALCNPSSGGAPEMTICPLEFRYGRPQLRGIFSEKGRLRQYLQVEAALAQASAEVGLIPKEAAREIAARAADGSVTVERVRSIEREIRHDLMAVVRALAEQCHHGAGRFVHLGATSYDIIDTAVALQLKESLVHIHAGVVGLRDELARLALKYRDLPQVGRTHGQWAIPTTFGLKIAVYAMEMERHRERLDQLSPRLMVGKMLGAVGTGAGLGPEARRIQGIAMERLGLGAALATTQVLQRDRLAELISWCANTATSLEKFATEVRNLQRSEIGEVAEAFDEERQVGSSTMAQKKNPVTCENICGIARVVRSLIIPAFENAILWHERDLANSSAERFIIPHALIGLDDILQKSIGVFSTLEVRPARMRANLDSTRGLIMAESVMVALTQAGMDRQEAHEFVRKASLAAERKGTTLRESLLAAGAVKVRKLLGARGLDAALEPSNYLGHAPAIVDDVVRIIGLQARASRSPRARRRSRPGARGGAGRPP